MTENKSKGVSAPENTNKINEEEKELPGIGITVSGISGTKTLRVGRVNKKPKEAVPDLSEQALEKPASAVSSSVVTEPKAAEVIVKPSPSVSSDVASDKVSDSIASKTTPVSSEQKPQAAPPTVKVVPTDKETHEVNTQEKTVAREPAQDVKPVVSTPGETPSVGQAPQTTPTRPGPASSQSGYQGQGTRPQGQGGYQGSGYQGQGTRPQGSGGYQGSGYQGQGTRPQGSGGYQGSGYQGQGTRPQGQGGYQGSGYQGQGTRPQGPGGYQGSGYQGQGQGTRPQGPGGYQGSGYQGQGTRPQGPGGFQGSRPQGQGGYQSGRPQGQGSFGAPRPRDGGFPPRDKDDGFVRSKEDNGYASRGPSRGGPGGKAGPKTDSLVDPKEKEKAKIAQRDAYEKSRKEPAKDIKKDAAKTTLPTADKRAGNKHAVNAAFSGRGASEILQDDTTLDTFAPYGSKSKRSSRRKPMVNQAPPPPKAVLSHVQLPEYITIKEFSDGIQKRSAEVIKKLMKLGVLATLNQEIDFDTATLIAAEFGITTEQIVEVTEEDILFDDTEDTDEGLETRPPVVVVMGHVDHGKTSLLDKIRSASVVKGEAGGITQHIGAYTVRLKGREITFLDTPGHEAFTTMRARGAQVTDIAILVVAADDGVMPQTIEAINHAKAANTEIVVAINKMDKPGANPDKVKQELSQHGIIPEEWGGSNVMVPVSAKTGDGIDDLLEMVLLTADVMDLKADPRKQAKGTVIEAKLDKNRGPVATVLVQRGTLHSGDTIVTGSIIGRIRAMTDDKSANVKKAGPSIPVEILGLPEVPEAGEIFYAVTDEKVARQLAEKRRVKQREDQLRKSSRMSLETLSITLAAGEVKDLNLIIKADVQGSVEAVTQSMEKLSNDEVHVKVIHGAVGTITESDIVLADVSNAIIIGFNVRPGTGIAEKAKESGVDIKLYRVIYSAIEDVEAAMKGLLKPKYEEIILGHIEIRQTFKVSNIGTIGGAYVTDGKVLRSSEVRVVRGGIVVHEGKLASLKRFKDDAREVAAGYECGISIESFNDIKEGDIVEAFEMREIARK